MLAMSCAPIFEARGAWVVLADFSAVMPFRKLGPSREPRSCGWSEALLSPFDFFGCGCGLGLAAGCFFSGCGLLTSAGLGCGAGFGLGGAGCGSPLVILPGVDCAASAGGPTSGACDSAGCWVIFGAADSIAASVDSVTSIGGWLNDGGWRHIRLNDSKANRATCPAIATPRPVFSVRSIVRPNPRSLLVLADRDQRDAIEPGAIELAHHLHDAAVIEPAIGTQEDLRRLAVARLRGDRLEAAGQIAFADRILVDEDRAGVVDRHLGRLLILIERLGAAVGQVDRHARGQQRRRHHEADQQHQHHVDQRRDVDLRHRRPPSAAAPGGKVHRHQAAPSSCRLSVAWKPSAKRLRRASILFTPWLKRL